MMSLWSRAPLSVPDVVIATVLSPRRCEKLLLVAGQEPWAAMRRPASRIARAAARKAGSFVSMRALSGRPVTPFGLAVSSAPLVRAHPADRCG
jgi:hypothetical protein